jgi:hypothetical protein
MKMNDFERHERDVFDICCRIDRARVRRMNLLPENKFTTWSSPSKKEFADDQTVLFSENHSSTQRGE